MTHSGMRCEVHYHLMPDGRCSCGPSEGQRDEGELPRAQDPLEPSEGPTGPLEALRRRVDELSAWCKEQDEEIAKLREAIEVLAKHLRLAGKKVRRELEDE